MAEPYLSNLESLVARLWTTEKPELECRHFFGGAALYSSGKICASLTPVGLAIKLPGPSRDAAMAAGVGGPLRYFDGGKVKKDYLLHSDAAAIDTVGVRKLMEEGFRYAAGLLAAGGWLK
jgi:hypothetical protein